MFSEGPSIFVPFFVMMGLWVFAFVWYPCCVTTSQDYIKVEHIRTWLLSSSLAKFQQFWYEGLLSSFSLCNSYCIQGWYSIDDCRVLVSHWVFWKFEINVFVLFFSSEIQTVFPLKPMFSEGPSIFVPFFVMMGLWVFAFVWYPCCVTTSQDYIKVEHIRTWLLSSSLAKFQQFWYEGLLSLCNSYCIQGWYSIDGFRVLVSHWGFLKVRE